MIWLAAGALVLLWLKWRSGALSWRFMRPRLLLLWPLAVTALYSLLWIERRYLGGMTVLFWLGTFGLLVTKVRREYAIVVLALLTAEQATRTANGVLQHAAESVQVLSGGKKADDLVVAERLASLGLSPNARLAVAGADFEPYYARVARDRVTAQIEDVDSFWHMDATARKRVETQLSGAGITALIARGHRPSWALAEGWIEVPQQTSPPLAILPLKN